MIEKFRKKLMDPSVKELKVAYFGGSITQGAGASKWSETCYRALVTKWLRETYKDKEITEINASIGGTGSDFGVYRMNLEITGRQPDLVFIEFCTNDSVLENCGTYEEGMIQNLRRDLPDCDIVLIETITEPMYKRLLKMEKIESVENYERLSHKYGIDLVNIGAEFVKRVQAGKGDFLTYTNEGVHPNDTGYSIYADKIIDYLKNVLSDKETDVLPKTSMVFCKDMDCQDFVYVNDDSFYQNMGYAFADEKGKKITFEFEGTAVGIIMHYCKESGKYLYRIDDGEYIERDSFDSYCLTFNRIGFLFFTRELKPGRHRLEIVAKGEKDERSEGCKIKITAFLCS